MVSHATYQAWLFGMAFVMMNAVGLVSCRAEIKTKVVSNCVKPTDANCKKTSGATVTFPNTKTLSMNSSQPTVSWDPLTNLACR